jgi:hypothetical protein
VCFVVRQTMYNACRAIVYPIESHIPSLGLDIHTTSKTQCKCSYNPFSPFAEPTTSSSIYQRIFQECTNDAQ